MQRLFPENVSSMGRAFVITAWIEALTWTGLLIGMFLKYVTDTTERGVEIMGPIHGAAFIAYAAVSIFTGITLKWKLHVTLIALLGEPAATKPAKA